jgi:crotonobetainyl-CoA:carnitine CoA-transferase CaiB-like acyl-CoA transferase
VASGAGEVRIPGFPAVWDVRHTPWHHRAAPMLGEHNEEIMRELGVGSDALERLTFDQVIGDRPVA